MMEYIALLAGLILLVEMARRGVKFLRASEELALSTLGTGSVVAGNFDSSVDSKTFLISADLVVSLEGLTAGEGPIVVGVAHADYTSTEIGEWFAGTGGWSDADLVAREVAKRKIREIGTFDGIAAEEVLNDGKPIHVRLGFNIEDGQTLKMWAFNAGSTNPLTTGAVLEMNGSVWARR